MAKKSKLLSALDAHKGRDYDQERQKKLRKSAEKKKRSKSSQKGAEEDGDNDDETPCGSIGQESKAKIDEQALDTGDIGEGDHDIAEGEEEEEDSEEEDEEEDIPLSDLSADDAADVIPHQRLTINNSAAIRSAIKRISLINEQTIFSEHQSLTSTEDIDIPDPNDDLNRELAFYKICVAAAKTARSLLKKEGIPFSRPKDFFAEMVKDDEHMDKIKKKLFDEAANKKASAEARKQRDLKKFGKQVQVAKLQERQKEKRETLEKINSLKRKRRSAGTGPTEDEELFDVALEDASKSNGGSDSRGKGQGVSKRQKKDKKFGFGGKKRFAKSGDAISSGDLSKFSAGKMKGKKAGAKRLGKSRRASSRP